MNLLKKMLPVLLLLVTYGMSAQVSEVEEWNKKANQTNEQAIKLDTTIRSTHQTVTTLKTTFTDIFGGKSDRKVVLGFSGAQYGDANLTRISEVFEKTPGVKDISKNVGNGLVTFEISTKREVVNLWEELPLDLRNLYQVVQADEQNMLVKYKAPAQEGVTTHRVSTGD